MSGSGAAPGSIAERGLLADNVVHFARVLRRAGLPIGPAKVVDALRALCEIGLERRDDFYFALSAVLVDRHEQQALFDQAFALFWRDPRRTGQALQDLLQQLGGAARAAQAQAPVAPRVAQAFWPALAPPQSPDDLPPDITVDASMTMSPRDLLRAKDFAGMSAEELAEARRMIAGLRLPLPQIPSRRARPRARGGQVDLERTMRNMIRSPDGLVALRHRSPRPRPPTLVILCDISGSMDRYTRMLLHFIHTVSNHRTGVHTFLFGTRLTNITRSLRDRDVDLALDRVAKQVADWAGGTRIGPCLNEFNRRWARRVLGQGAVVLLISDGLDSEGAEGLGAEMERLRLACRRLIWLNPLLRYAGFEARPAGIRAMLPHVDLFLPAHNIASLAQLAQALGQAK
ncbi:MAG: vWA domain-containing protein [Noviherbaspirillum sp.]